MFYNRGLCCQLQRRHRQTPRKVRPLFHSIVHVDVDVDVDVRINLSQKPDSDNIQSVTNSNNSELVC